MVCDDAAHKLLPRQTVRGSTLVAERANNLPTVHYGKVVQVCQARATSQFAFQKTNDRLVSGWLLWQKCFHLSLRSTPFDSNNMYGFLVLWF